LCPSTIIIECRHIALADNRNILANNIKQNCGNSCTVTASNTFSGSGLATSSSFEVPFVITLSDFPHQTGKSVTNLQLDCNDHPSGVSCQGAKEIGIPGIGEGFGSVFLGPFLGPKANANVDLDEFPGQTGPTDIPTIQLQGPGLPQTEPVTIPGIGSGVGTLVYFDG